MRILEAAEHVFTEIGYGASSMEEIARKAGMSKKTVYALFSDKRAVFAALISHVDAEAAVTQNLKRVKTRAELRNQLVALSEFAVGRRQVELTRLVISEAKQCPELAEEFHERIIRTSERNLTDAVRLFTKRNDTAAELLGAVIGDLHLRMLLGVKPLSRRAMADHIQKALDLLLPATRK